VRHELKRAQEGRFGEVVYLVRGKLNPLGEPDTGELFGGLRVLGAFRAGDGRPFRTGRQAKETERQDGPFSHHHLNNCRFG
jgi:hypothetical protein